MKSVFNEAKEFVMLTGPLITLGPPRVTGLAITIPPVPIHVAGNSIPVTTAALSLYRNAAAAP